jgi:iron complex outermembrane receptor protein
VLLQDFGSRKADSSNFSPKAVLDFKLSDDELLYASYSKGFKSGTYNIIAIYTPTQYIEPEETTAYELGFKSSLLDGALRFNAAIFQNQIDKLQVQTISLTSGGAVRFETAGSARIRGADFDATWEVLPETIPGLVVTAGGALLDGKYTDYQRGSGYDETSGVFFDGTVFPTRNYTGNDLVRTPKFSGNAGLSYSFALGSGSVEIAGDTYYNAGFYYSAQNTPVTREQSYQLYNARISYLYEPWNLRVTAFGKNLTDAKYHYVVQELDFATAKLLAPPAFYGLRLNWDF